MRLSWVLTVLSICLSATATGSEGKRKLQIGVKKRVDHCPIKSRKGDVLHMHYTGKLEDGTEFDSSLPQNQPFVFSLGTGQVIKGWDQGLLGMCEGEKRKLVIPSELGYGERGAPPKIPGGELQERRELAMWTLLTPRLWSAGSPSNPRVLGNYLGPAETGHLELSVLEDAPHC
ncbi:peptidyl-prolyl cis-trans isomerase FKBP2 isoform X2 [Heterocephalus glaber]|nr:peptidyl-prolyl cis-trans isomerase FKBP2 isoform X2 [Heterocephalus glaber]XP_021120338.1 peptidyl-prolyl cis-trans isomerase FKBP2 isoform X2 [Heterocephalus glaber]